MIQPFDGRKGKRLPYEIVGDMRFFGFHIGNETILATTKWGANCDLGIVFDSPSIALGNIFKLELFRNYGIEGNRQNNAKRIGIDLSSSELIGEYLQSLKEKTEFSVQFDQFQSENSNNWRDAIVRFFTDLGNRNLNTEPLKNYKSSDPEEENDYAYWIISEGGYLEKTAAIFCNVMRMDKKFNLINEDWARHRASQYIRLINDGSDSYKVEPKFKEWETELWM